jgi:hypothetical protein
VDAPPSWITEPLSWIGINWPEQDSGRFDAMSDVYLRGADELSKLVESANRFAALVWTQNRGDAVKTFRKSWTGPGGPADNMAQTFATSVNHGVGAKAMATVTRVLKAAFCTECGILVGGLVAAGILVVTTGGLALVAGMAINAAAVQGTRITLGKLIKRILGLLVVMGIIWLLFQGPFSLEKARELTRELTGSPDHEDEEEPDDKPKPKPDSVIDEWDDLDRPRCWVPPNVYIQTPLYTGSAWDASGLDKRVAGGGIYWIDKQRPYWTSDAIAATVYGRLGPGIDRQGFEDILPLPGAAGLPGYHRSHLVGPGNGIEASIVMYGPSAINVGAQSRSEDWGRSVYEYAAAQGGYVEYKAYAESFASSIFKDPNGKPIGDKILYRHDYEATVCLPRGNGYYPEETYLFGYKVGEPTQDPRTGKFNGKLYEIYATRPPINEMPGRLR